MVEAVRESTPSDLNWGPTLEDFFRRMRARLGSSQGVVDELNEFLCDGDWRLAVRHVDAGGKETRGVLLPEFRRHEARLFWEPNANGFDQIAAYYPAGGWVELVDSLGAAVKICLLDGDTEFIGRHSDLESWEGTKSAVHFSPDRPLPKALVRKLIRARIAEAKAKKRGG